MVEAEEIMVVISLEDRGDQGDKGRVVRGGVRQVPQWRRWQRLSWESRDDRTGGGRGGYASWRWAVVASLRRQVRRNDQ